LECYNKTTHKIPTHAGFAQHTSAVSAGALNINITQETCEMTLLYIKIIKVRASFGGFIQFHKFQCKSMWKLKSYIPEKRLLPTLWRSWWYLHARTYRSWYLIPSVSF